MKVCHFVGSTLAGQYFINLANEFPKRGISLSFASLHKEKVLWLEDYKEIKFINLGTKSRLDYPAAILRLASFLKREKVEILQIHLFDGGLVGIPAGRLAGVKKIIYTRHHSDLVHKIGKNYHIALDRWMARSADKVVAVSQAVKDFMIESDFISPEKIEVVHLGFDFKNMRPENEAVERIREEFRLEKHFVVGCIASFQKIKGHKYLLEAIAQIKNQISQIKLLLLGSGDRTSIDEDIKRLGLEKDVIFAGYRNDVPACIRAMDLVVHPSLSEAFCQVIIEVMSSGTALIATDVGGANEVITNDENGSLIAAGNVDRIVESILNHYNHPEFSRELAIKGKRSVIEQFSSEIMTDKYIKLYSSLLN